MSFLNNPAIKALIPSSLGIVGSIAFHLIFFSTGLSNFASAQIGKEKEDIVPVIELTAEERERLPNTNSSADLSAINNPFYSSKSTTIPNNSNSALLPTPNARVTIPNNSPSLTYYRNLDTSSLFPTAPNNYVGAGTGTTTNTYRGSTRVVTTPRRLGTLANLGNTTQKQIKVNDGSLFPPPPPNAVSDDKKTTDTNNNTNNSNDRGIMPNSVSNTMGGLQASKFEVTEENDRQDTLNTSENNDRTPTEEPTNNNTDPKSSTVNTAEEIRNRQQVLAKIYRERQLSLSRDEKNTTDREANNNYLTWLEETKNTKPNRMTIAGTYPQDACQRRLQGNAIYGVTISQGKASNLNLIQSSGYPILNQQAANDIQNRTFFNNLNGATQVTVTFNSDNSVCTGKVVTPNETIETPQVITPTNNETPIDETPTSNSEVRDEKQNTPNTPATNTESNERKNTPSFFKDGEADR